MKLDPEIRALLDEERFDAVEDRWLSRLETAPGDRDFFFPVLRAMLERQQQERAELLLQLFLEALPQEAGAAEMEALQELLRLWPESPALRAAVLDALRRRHRGSPNLELLLQHFRLQDGAEPLGALQQVLAWLAYDVGRPVFLPTRGCGRVRELNLALGTLRVDFAGNLLSFRRAEAEHLLQGLGEEHFLVQKLQGLPALQEQAATAPGELLQGFFASFGSPVPLATLREHLRDVVPQESWNTWWKRARADRRLTVSAGTRPLCSWSQSAAAADEDLAAAFAAAAPLERLEMARTQAGRSESLRRLLAQGLRRSLEGALEPPLALETLLVLEDLGDGGEASDTPARIAALLRRDDAAAVVSGVRERRCRERALERLRDLRPDWPQLYLDCLGNEMDGRTLAWLYEARRGAPDPAALERLVSETLARPARSPRFFLWLCRELPQRPELSPRADWRLLRRLLEACTDAAFKGQRPALKECFDPGGVADLALAGLDAEQSAQLLALLERDVGLEEHRKQELRSQAWSRFPELREAAEEALYNTSEALDRQRAAFDQLVRVDLPHNTEEIRKAAAHGDLRENFEYKAARERQEMLSARARMLHEELRRARALEPAGIDPSAIRVGTRVKLAPSTRNGSPVVLTILGPWDSDPAHGIVSYLAPAVAALLGKRPGEAVRFGDQDFVVEHIEVWR